MAKVKQNNFKVVPLHQGCKPRITNLAERLYHLVYEYVEQEASMGRSVTVAELVGTAEWLKDNIKKSGGV